MWIPDVKLARSFLAVAREQSMTAAARILNSTQPTISGHIKELESQLGFSLFERSTRRIELTADGTNILIEVESFLESSEKLECRARQLYSSQQKHFRLAATMYTLDFPERIRLLDAFEAAHPNVNYTVDNFLQSEQLPKLLAGLLDASLLLGCQIAMEDYEEALHAIDKVGVANELLYPATLERVVIGSRNIELLVPEESNLAQFELIPSAALEGWTVSMLGPAHGGHLLDPITKFFEQCGARIYVPADTNAVAVNRYAQQHRLPSIDLGWHGKPSGPPGEMVRRPVEGLEVSTDFSVVLGKNPSAAATKFFEFTKNFVNPRA